VKFVRTSLPIYLGVLGGLTIVLAKFFSPAPIQTLSNWFMQWRVILSAFALSLGAGNLLRIHSNRIRTKTKAHGYSYVLLVCLIGYFLIGVLFKRTNAVYAYIFDWVYNPLSATVFSLNAFYISTACYRAFRARNLQAAVLLIAGVVVMLGKVGIGYAMWPGFAAVTDWIMNIPNSAAMRGVNIGAALGVLGVSLRVVLGLERGHLGGE